MISGKKDGDQTWERNEGTCFFGSPQGEFIVVDRLIRIVSRDRTPEPPEVLGWRGEARVVGVAFLWHSLVSPHLLAFFVLPWRRWWQWQRSPRQERISWQRLSTMRWWHAMDLRTKAGNLPERRKSDTVEGVVRTQAEQLPRSAAEQLPVHQETEHPWWNWGDSRNHRKTFICGEMMEWEVLAVTSWGGGRGMANDSNNEKGDALTRTPIAS